MKPGRHVITVSLCLLVLNNVAPAPSGAPKHSTWSEPVNLGPTINSTFSETAPSLSKNGLSLYFSSNRPCGPGDAVADLDIWVAQRATEDAPWGTPQCLAINVDGFEDSAAAFSRDGHWMFFVSSRPGSQPGIGPPNPAFNARDLWASYRPHVHDDYSWTPAVNAGSVNSNQAEAGPTYFEGDGITWPQLLFTSNRGGTFDIWQADVFGDGQVGVATLVADVSTATEVEARPSIRHDGLELFLFRTSQGAANSDIFAATRVDTSRPWSVPQNVGAPVNTTSNEQQPFISADRRTLYFASDRSGVSLDLWVSTRDKAHP
jgi:hypothetical protein